MFALGSGSKCPSALVTARPGGESSLTDSLAKLAKFSCDAVNDVGLSLANVVARASHELSAFGSESSGGFQSGNEVCDEERFRPNPDSRFNLFGDFGDGDDDLGGVAPFSMW